MDEEKVDEEKEEEDRGGREEYEDEEEEYEEILLDYKDKKKCVDVAVNIESIQKWQTCLSH